MLVANRPLTSASLTLQVQRVHGPDPAQIAQHLTGATGYQWLRSLPATTVHTIQLTNTNQYSRMLKAYRAPSGPSDQFWSVGQVAYRPSADGHVAPTPHGRPDPATWLNPAYGYYAPQSNNDVGFRRLQVHYSSNRVINNVFSAPKLHLVGTFNPDMITGFGDLSKVPLTTYFPPDAAPGDARTNRLLHGQSLLPSNNIAGYLQQPPMMLTTIESLHSFTDSDAFGEVEDFAKAPISVIRVRVAGVTGVDKLSVARVRIAAETIARTTGLAVDITMGSSPHQELIDLPAGRFGRPPLVLSEGWVKKGVAVALLSAVDTKSLTLFALVLLVCTLFLVNATVAAVRTRRTELGVLACLGWPARKIFALLEMELVLIGVVAGVTGTALAAAVTVGFDLNVSWDQVALITPIAVLLASFAGIGPAWRACHATPMEAITPSVRLPRKAANVTSITGLAITGLGRCPGRTILGAASLFVGVAALAVLIAIQQAFQGGVIGTSLGNVVAIQVRGVDYLAAALTIALGAFAVADVAYLNISERVPEIGTLRSTGWADQHVRRLFGSEGLLTAAVGAALGAGLSVAGVAVLLPIPIATALIAATVAGLVGTVAAVLALLIPLTRLSRLAPANAITSD